MKLKTLLLTAALVSTCLRITADEAPDAHGSKYLPSDTFTEFIGLEVRNLQNERLGKVKHITLDLQNGRVAEVVVRSNGGLFGIGSQHIAVAPRALALDTRAKCLRLNASKARFLGAPHYDQNHMRADTARDEISRVTRYFGLEPWFFEEGENTQKNTQTLRLGPIARTDQILGLPVRNTQGDYLGNVDTLRMDLPKGHIIHVVTTNRTSQAPDSVVQPRAMRFNSAMSALIVDNAHADMADEPHFKWLNNKRTSYKEEQYVNRDESSASMEQGQNFRDRQKTSRIRAAIQQDRSLSASARQIEVVTLNAQTTLRGRVSSADEKRRLGEIAVKAGRLENVSNLIEVR